MENELAHSFNIKLNDVVRDQIVEIQKRLNQQFTEQRVFDPSPHLSVLLKFADANMTADFTERLVAEFEDEACWELTLGDFSLSSSREYIFLGLDELSRQKVMTIHERALSVVREIGSGGATSKYVFDPHISIIKLLPEESKVAMQLLHNELYGVRFRVGAYTITVDDAHKTGSFRVLKELVLRA